LSLRAVDARFLLPLVPESAVVLGELPAWRDGLSSLGVELVEPEDGSDPDLVVAPADQAARALAVGAETALVLGGRVDRAVLGGLESTVYRAVPDLAAPEYLVPLHQPKALRYFYDFLRVAPGRAKWWRNRIAARAGGSALGRFVPADQLVTVVGARADVPAALRPVADATGMAVEGWLLGLGPPHAERRVVFSLFEPASRMPRLVAKLDRLPGARDAEDGGQVREEDVRELELRAPPLKGHVPHVLPPMIVGESSVSIESAGAGFVMTDYLRGPFRRSKKLTAIDRVATWLIEVAVASAREGEGPLSDVTLTSGPPPADSAPVAQPGAVGGIPEVVEHGDLWSGNVILGPDGKFTVIDWADANPRGLPLRDLLYFLSESLAWVDGTSTHAERVRHFAALFRGEAPSSAVLFRWVRAMVEALGIERDAVGPLATCCWDDLASRRRAALSTTPTLILESMGPDAVEPALRKAELWNRESGLGAAWDAWRR
jgi:hypothetical protein